MQTTIDAIIAQFGDSPYFQFGIGFGAMLIAARIGHNAMVKWLGSKPPANGEVADFNRLMRQFMMMRMLEDFADAIDKNDTGEYTAVDKD